ncbi:hypothetical protein AVEN_171869-1 [Araneus ventricosus]|uniref:Uncharacterized protein n=1 Tax=Araneus ventricosus TaxID=182803 RepID=A0A4Y2IRQ5_ARAVE|nr:hypothetical protein AVEN_171869-1 [Araneus ventricosus]
MYFQEFSNHKKLSPRPALASGSTVNDRPPRLHRALWPPHKYPHHERLMRRPLYYRGKIRHRRWALTATPPLLYPPRSENLLTYMAASHP